MLVLLIQEKRVSATSLAKLQESVENRVRTLFRRQTWKEAKLDGFLHCRDQGRATAIAKGSLPALSTIVSLSLCSS